MVWNFFFSIIYFTPFYGMENTESPYPKQDKGIRLRRVFPAAGSGGGEKILFY